MKNILHISLLGFLILFLSCTDIKKNDPDIELYRKLEQLPDSIRVDDIVIINIFKNQILAHRKSSFDSLRIIEKVYRPHQSLWDNCYALLFGEENSSKFNTTKGMIEWNRTLYPENKDFFNKKTNELLNINIDSALTANLNRFEKIVPYSPKAKISIIFTPFQGIGFGGCNAEQFCYELNNKDYDVTYTIEKGIPHELSHLANEPLTVNNQSFGTALFLTIEEGFASYFTWIFFEGKISKWEAVENMNEEEWNWYLNHEKELFTNLNQYFEDKTGNNPLLQNEEFKLFPSAPRSLYYWLGFRIIESYVKQNGKESWKELYGMDAKDILEKSGYENYINNIQE